MHEEISKKSIPRLRVGTADEACGSPSGSSVELELVSAFFVFRVRSLVGLRWLPRAIHGASDCDEHPRFTQSALSLALARFLVAFARQPVPFHGRPTWSRGRFRPRQLSTDLA